MPDIAIPIVFPDYLIAVNTPKTKVKVPDLIPGFDLFPDAVVILETKNKLPERGHAEFCLLMARLEPPNITNMEDMPVRMGMSESYLFVM